MNIWLIQVGEPLPIDGPNERLFRKGMINDMLTERGHNILWWTSSFDHTKKRNRFKEDTRIRIDNGSHLQCLHATPYKKNISLKRIFNHIGIARKFRRLANLNNTPDLILCSFPPIELCYEGVKYAKAHNVPIVVDIEDFWPDMFLDYAPLIFRPILKTLMWRWYRMNTFIFKNCDTITGITQSALGWGLTYGKRHQKIDDRVFPLGYSDARSCENSDEIALNMSRIGIDTTKLIFLFIGTFGRTYDLETVIRSVKKLDSIEKDRVQFVLCGDGERMKKWKSMALSEKNIIFPGWVNKDQIHYLLKNADVGLTSYAKGAPQELPNKIFEYMSAGLPLLSSLSGEGRKLISHNACGSNYQAGDVNALLRGIRILIDDKQRTTMANNSLKLYRANFQAANVYLQFCVYLEEVKKQFHGT